MKTTLWHDDDMTPSPDKQFVLLFFTGIVFFILTISNEALAGASLSLVAEDQERPDSISLVIGRAERIAGLKVTINYDKDKLKFKNAEKSTSTSSFLHVVNDKYPGRLIVVMASAKGVSGDMVPLLHLTFTPITNTENNEAKVSVTQVQLMTEDLKEIRANMPNYTFK